MNFVFNGANLGDRDRSCPAPRMFGRMGYGAPIRTKKEGRKHVKRIIKLTRKADYEMRKLRAEKSELLDELRMLKKEVHDLKEVKEEK